MPVRASVAPVNVPLSNVTVGAKPRATGVGVARAWYKSEAQSHRERTSITNSAGAEQTILWMSLAIPSHFSWVYNDNSEAGHARHRMHSFLD